mmetsp:Transcript_3188/g.6862  ORF Transcript_3188/g.6862 Transcript_3188/m.6862 type:complete len:506 (+) Transcript_3188:1175-2692(+)
MPFLSLWTSCVPRQWKWRKASNSWTTRSRGTSRNASGDGIASGRQRTRPMRTSSSTSSPNSTTGPQRRMKSFTWSSLSARSVMSQSPPSHDVPCYHFPWWIELNYRDEQLSSYPIVPVPPPRFPTLPGSPQLLNEGTALFKEVCMKLDNGNAKEPNELFGPLDALIRHLEIAHKEIVHEEERLMRASMAIPSSSSSVDNGSGSRLRKKPMRRVAPTPGGRLQMSMLMERGLHMRMPMRASEYANKHYPKLARPVSTLPSGKVGTYGKLPGMGRAPGGASVLVDAPTKPPTSTSTSQAERTAAGVEEREMRAASGGAAAAVQADEVEALRQRVKARQAKDNASLPQDPQSRLDRHLRMRGFRIKDVPGDNNCQFHAISDQLEMVGIKGWTASKLREETVAWLKANGDRPMDDGKVGQRTMLKDYLVGVDNWGQYIREMSQHGVTWGDEATLLAASVLFRAEICVISSLSPDYCHIVTPPDLWGIELRTRIYLGHFAEYHYVSTRAI